MHRKKMLHEKREFFVMSLKISGVDPDPARFVSFPKFRFLPLLEIEVIKMILIMDVQWFKFLSQAFVTWVSEVNLARPFENF